MFLLPNVNLKVRPKLVQDLEPGTRIVSKTFNMGAWKAEKGSDRGRPGEQAWLSDRLYWWTAPTRNGK